MNQKKYFFDYFFSALRSEHYSLPILIYICWSKWQNLIQSKMEVIMPEQENSWMKPVATGISIQGNLPSICQPWLTANLPSWRRWFLLAFKCRSTRRFRSGVLLSLSHLCKLHSFVFCPAEPIVSCLAETQFLRGRRASCRKAVFNQGHKRWTSRGCLW